MRVALLQIPVCADLATHHAVAYKAIQDACAQRVDMAMLPEIWNGPYAVDQFHRFAEPIPGGPTFEKMSSWAKEFCVTLVGGSIAEKGDDGKVYNTSCVFSPTGELLAKHRKVHLFDIDVPGGICFKESDSLSAGADVTTFTLSSTVKAGLGICYDIRFAPLSFAMREQGSSVLFFPAAFNMTTGPLHWSLLARSRALDTQSFTVLCSPARAESGYVAYGHSMVVDPWGKVVGELDEKPGTLICELDLSQIEAVRKAIPISKQQRSDVYTKS